MTLKNSISYFTENIGTNYRHRLVNAVEVNDGFILKIIS
jgi:hypothetical protein